MKINKLLDCYFFIPKTKNKKLYRNDVALAGFVLVFCENTQLFLDFPVNDGVITVLFHQLLQHHNDLFELFRTHLKEDC